MSARAITSLVTAALMTGSAAFGAEVVSLGYPQPAPKFDYTTIDRAVKEPKYASEKPAHRFLAFGPKGQFVVALVADESKGTGSGFDTLYADLNGNHDLTEPAERFPLKAAYKVKGRGRRKDLVKFRLAGWGTTIISLRKLAVPDPKFDYQLSAGYGFVYVMSKLKDKSWGFPMRVMDDNVPWSLDKAKAPVVRFGGDEFTFANADRFIRRGRKAYGTGDTAVKPGDGIFIDGTAPFFYGSSPEVGLGKGAGVYCPWSDRGIEAWVESVPEGGRILTRLPFYPSCGGAYWASILANTSYPPGKATLVLRMTTGSHLGVVEQRIPFTVDNPRYGKPVEELTVTKRLKGMHPGATVLEVFQGAPLTQLGVPTYDGARDVYFGEFGKHSGFGQSCTNLGTGLSYGREMRYELHLGGEGRRTLIKYDLSMLATDATVEKAVLAVYVRKLNKKVDLACRAFALKKAWSEKRINYASALTALPGRRARYPVGRPVKWETRMFQGESDRHAEPVGSLTFRSTGWAQVDVTSAVQKWVSGEWSNHGLGLEMVEERIVNGRVDVLMVASDYAVDPALRPRLILAVKGKPKARPFRVTPAGGEPDAAMAKALAEGKLVLCNVLSADSVTSRAFETRVLASPAVKQYVAKHFIEVRLDGGDLKHTKFLQKHGVRRFPAALVLSPRLVVTGDVALIEPFDWDAMFGVPRSSFEFEQTYAQELQRVLNRAAKSGGRLRPLGTEVGGCGAGGSKL